MKGKIQKNDYGNNILVEIEANGGSHISHLDKDCVVLGTLTGNDVIERGMELIEDMEGKELLAMCKDLLKKVDGYAVSNVSTNREDYPDAIFVNHGDIIFYK